MKIDYTDSEHIWPFTTAAALLDGATAPSPATIAQTVADVVEVYGGAPMPVPPRSAADAHQAQQDDRLTALEGQLAQTLNSVVALSSKMSETLDVVLDLATWRVQDVEPWRLEVNRRLAHLETVAQRLLNPGEEEEP